MAVPMVAEVREALIAEAALPDGELVGFDLFFPRQEPEAVLALRRGDAVQVWLNVCPHAGRRLDYAPGRFLMHAGRLVCAAHGAQFQLEDGACIDGPGRGGRLAALSVRAGNGGWWVSPPSG